MSSVQENTVVSNESSVSEKKEILEKIENDPVLLEGILESPKVQSIIVQQRLHSGPLPPAEDIELYNRSIPNGADRIMRMAEKAQDNGYQVRVKELSIQSKGQDFAITVVLVFAILAGFIAYLGDTVTAAALMGATLASIIGTFIYGALKKK